MTGRVWDSASGAATARVNPENRQSMSADEKKDTYEWDFIPSNESPTPELGKQGKKLPEEKEKG
jgi:hypothetical protein